MALSCCDYLVNKKKENNNIKVITIFTSFKTNNLNKDAQYYLRKSLCKNTSQFEQMRKKEDINALDFLEFEYEHWDFIDGGFRENNRKLIYKSYRQLFSGKVSTKDKLLTKKILEKLKPYQNKFDEIIVPLGVGHHADHLIIKLCGEKIFDKNKIRYFVDWPYAFKFKRWDQEKIKSVLTSGKYITLTSRKKRKAIQCYQSQVKLLFGKKPMFYPELVLNKNTSNNQH